MSNFRFSTFILEMLGSSKQEATLALHRDNEYNNHGVVLSEHKMASDVRFGGLSSMDRAHAESVANEFDRVNNPWLYSKNKKF